MNETLQKRVRSAAVAGWWTILIAAVWMTVGWVGFLVILNTEPGWLLRLWGYPDADSQHWEQVRTIVLYFFSIFKLILFMVLIIVIWLTLWSRRLKREG